MFETYFNLAPAGIADYSVVSNGRLTAKLSGAMLHANPNGFLSP